jgi:small subunit ribosomal protein S9
MVRLKIAEPLLLAPAAIEGIDISIDVKGGGLMGQAEAVPHRACQGNLLGGRMTPDQDVFLSYDRTLLVNDSVRKNRRNPMAGCEKEVPKVLSLRYGK